MISESIEGESKKYGKHGTRKNLRTGKTVSLYFSTDASMVFPDATTDCPERESCKHHMTNNIALFSGKMMVGHGGLLSGSSVGRASLCQKIPSCPSLYFMWCSCKENLPISEKMCPKLI
jgi:hypothetical protein